MIWGDDMNQDNKFRYVNICRVSPSQYEFAISHPSNLDEPIVMVYQFKSQAAAEIAALHYEKLVEKAYNYGFTLSGYYLYGPSGQVLPVSDVFDLDMSIGHVEQRLSSVLESIDISENADVLSPVQSMS